jgi:hypothetical protein
MTERPGADRRGDRHASAGPDGARRVPRRRLGAFAVVLVLCLGSLGGYLVLQRHQDDAAAAAAAGAEAGRDRLKVADVLAVPHLVVRNTEPGPSFGKIALVPLDDPSGPRAIVDVPCSRVSSTPAGTLCLQEVTGLVTTYEAVFLDARLQPTGTQPLGGIPSRARMSADGSWAASTVFVAGHSYADAQFSTETVVTDMATRTSLGSLESWTALRDGVPMTAKDLNYWGVSFVGAGPEFYVTLGTGGQRYLVRGNAATRTLTVLGIRGACPSVSPDGSSVVYKQQDPESHNDHFVAMDAAGVTTPLQEGRLVDDQVAWADEDTVLYAVSTGVSGVEYDVWTAPIHGGAPSRMVVDAASPSVVRPVG